MAFDYTNLYPDTSANGGYTKSWNYTTVVDSIATCSASGYFNKVATRLGIGDHIVIARVDAFDTKNRTTLAEFADLFVTGIAGGVVTTTNYSTIANGYTDTVAALKANLASPTFTGVPAAPTASLGTNTTQIATMAAIQAAIANLVNSAPGALDTLNELAVALGNDASFASTVTTALALKAPLASPTLTTPNIGVATGTSLAVSGALTSSGAAGVGYVTGAGGTVTQATSKATGVTLSKASGAITMNNAALAAATIVSFVLTNTSIAATDVLILNHISGGTVGSYTLNAQCGAGSATINVRNNTAGSLGDAIVIQFALVKAVNA